MFYLHNLKISLFLLKVKLYILVLKFRIFYIFTPQLTNCQIDN